VAPAEYVGSESCGSCHTVEFAEWRQSQHAKAMQHANAATVLGNFKEVSYEYNGITSRFFIKDGKFFVNTDGPDGKMTDYQISYTFGLDPMQQYLIAFPDGRMQALSIAWDARPADQGGTGRPGRGQGLAPDLAGQQQGRQRSASGPSSGCSGHVVAQ
jgi:hypothetical protein